MRKEIKISVCLVTHNGEKFIREQINSILPQLNSFDELVISDDGSTDNTLDIINSYSDSRIKLFHSHIKNDPVRNFENALSNSTGEMIFLSDQDDIWSDKKIKVMSAYLQNYDLVLCDGLMVNEDLSISKGSLYRLNRSGRGILRNIWKNGYMACCMAFKKEVLEKALPFPRDIPMHDQWLGIIGELYFSPILIPDQLILYRRHNLSFTSTGAKSNNSILKRLIFRFNLVKNLINLHL